MTPTARPALILLAALSVATARAEETPRVAAPAPAAPQAGTFPLADYEAILMLTAGADLSKDSAERRRQRVQQNWDGLPEATRLLTARQVDWAREHLADGGRAAWTTARGIAFFVVGPPSRRHEAPARNWTGETVRRLDSTAEIVEALAEGTRAAVAAEAAAEDGGAAAAPARAAGPTLVLKGTLRSETWVYSTAVPLTLRVLTFVDDDGDGSLRLVADALVDAASQVSSAPGVELPADLYPQASAGRAFDPLPTLAQDVLVPRVETASFKAHSAKTHVRFYVALSPEDVQLELDVPAAEYLAKAKVHVRIEQGGEPVEQLELVPADTPLESIDGHLVADVGAPLLPGEYNYVAQVTDETGRGGKASGRLSVPSLGGGLALSTPLLAKAEGDGDAAALPKAPVSATGAAAPFQLGSYLVKPQVTRSFRRGDTLAVVVQAYNSASATLDFDLEYEGTWQANVESAVGSLPHTEIQIFPVVPEWPDGSYALVVTATDPAGAKVAARVPFKVKG